MKISLVVPTYTLDEESEQMAVDCINSYKQFVDEVIVVEDAGTYSQKLESLADIYRKNQENLGFTKNVNLGWSLASGDYVMIVNSDTTLVKGDLNDLCIPNTVTSPLIENQEIKGLAGPFFVVPKEVEREYGKLNDVMETYYSDEEYSQRINHIFTKVESVVIHHKDGGGVTVKKAGVEGRTEIDKKKYEESGLNLYLAVGPYPIHDQHKRIMASIPGQWELSDKYIKQDGTKQYAVDEIPHKDGTIQTIYASHILEHISHREVTKTLEYWHSKLRKGGQIIINVPDLEWVCAYFLRILHEERKGNDVGGYYDRTIDYGNGYEHDFLQIIYGSHANEGEVHKSGFTKESLEGLLFSAGFDSVRIIQKVEAHNFGCLLAVAKKL